MACLRGTLRDSATIGVEQNNPMCTPGVAKLAVVDATALDRRDHRLWQAQEGEHHGAAALHQLPRVAASTVCIGTMGCQFLKVMAGGEGRSVSRQHHRADALVPGKAFELLRQRRQHRLGQAVARLWAVECENRNTADGFPQQRRRSGRRPGTGRRLSRHGFPGVSFISLLLSATGTTRKVLRNAGLSSAFSLEQ